MTDYQTNQNLLTFFAQLTPWVQALLGLGAYGVVLGVAYLLKETVATLIRPFLCSDELKRKSRLYTEKPALPLRD